MAGSYYPTFLREETGSAKSVVWRGYCRFKKPPDSHGRGPGNLQRLSTPILIYKTGIAQNVSTPFMLYRFLLILANPQSLLSRESP